MAAPQGVNFDGVNDWLELAVDLTGNADSKLVTGSFWVRFTSATGSTEMIWLTDTSLTTTPKFRINRTSSESITFLASDSAHSLILFASTSAAFADTAWHHVVFSFDMSDTAKRHIYVDDVSDLSASIYTDAAIDFAPGGTVVHLVGGNGPAGGSLSASLPGDLADFWLAPGVYIDLSVEANRRKFVGASAANAVDLGEDGSTPTGSAPLVFLSGATATWHTNKGTGEGFTENGALGDASANPPDYASAGASATVSPPAAAISLSPVAPVLETDAVPDRPDAVSLSLSPQAPVVGQSKTLAIPDTAQITLSPVAPAFSHEIRPAAASISLSAPAPELDVDYAALPDSASLQVSPVAPRQVVGNATIRVPRVSTMLSVQLPDASGVFFAGKTGTVSVGRGLSYLEGVTDTRTTVGGKGVVEEVEEFE